MCIIPVRIIVIYLHLILCVYILSDVAQRVVYYCTGTARLNVHSGGVATINIGPDVSFSPIICRAIVTVITG